MCCPNPEHLAAHPNASQCHASCIFAYLRHDSPRRESYFGNTVPTGVSRTKTLPPRKLIRQHRPRVDGDAVVAHGGAGLGGGAGAEVGVGAATRHVAVEAGGLASVGVAARGKLGRVVAAEAARGEGIVVAAFEAV